MGSRPHLEDPLATVVAVGLLAAVIGGCTPARADDDEKKAPPPAEKTDEKPDAPEEKKVTENRLAKEKSPYLLQHKNNPVDWYPWGAEAFEKAKKEDKPIFLSIGYAACHWCHVMEHESFENETIAKILNEHFVSIKVDREERPDVDNIYMTACQAMTGGGGWPLTVFLTPSMEPFFAGTYFPPEDKWGRPGFKTLLEEIAKDWKGGREQFLEMAKRLTGRIRELQQNAAGEGLPDAKALLNQYYEQCVHRFDDRLGGFGRAPKFPRPTVLDALLRHWYRTGEQMSLAMTVGTLDAMAAGGMYDQVGGGFHRYSVDAEWLVPHFEKMLYDNAQLASSYLDAWLITGSERHARIVRETLDWTLREMTHEEGGFYSSLDADSLDEKGHKEEGAFYVWSPAEIDAVLDEELAALYKNAFGVTEKGNFEESGKTVLFRDKKLADLAKLTGKTEEVIADKLEEARQRLYDAREKRARPGLDDKVLTSWNGLMIGAMARAGAALPEPRYLEAAKKAADFILTTLRTDEGRLLRRWREGHADFKAYLDDYAFLGNGLLDLYGATGDLRWLNEARALADATIELFLDAENGGFFFTGTDHEELLARSKDPYDGALPSGNSMAALLLVRMGELTLEARYRDTAAATLTAFGGDIERSTFAYPQLLVVLDRVRGPSNEIVIAGDPESDETKAMIAAVRKRFFASAVTAIVPAGGVDEKTGGAFVLLAGKKSADGKPTAYVCESGVCHQPVTTLEELEKALDAARESGRVDAPKEGEKEEEGGDGGEDGGD